MNYFRSVPVYNDGYSNYHTKRNHRTRYSHNHIKLSFALKFLCYIFIKIVGFSFLKTFNDIGILVQICLKFIYRTRFSTFNT